MRLALFDLDNTLIANDSDYLWGQFLVDRGIVDRASYEEANLGFYEAYKQGNLDIVAFLNFSLAPLAQHEPEQLWQWRREFIKEIIMPFTLDAARELVERHRQAGDTLVIITATNRFVTEPIAELYGIPHLLATSPEFIDGRYTGRFVGKPCFQSGKVDVLNDWLAQTQLTLQDSIFYSDSHNDLPLLTRVDHPVAVDPDDKLRDYAAHAKWPIISLRGA